MSKMTKTLSTVLKDQVVIIRPDDGKDREFVLSFDKHGVNVTDAKTKLTVTLDWFGTNLSAVVFENENADPIYIKKIRCK